MNHASLPETRREYIHVGSTPASMRARVSDREAQSLSLEYRLALMDYYELFSLEVSFVIDRSDLQARYRDMQRAMHPDRFVSAGDQERRIAMQKSTQINEAFRILNDPMERARYLLELGGYAWSDEASTTRDSAFLIEQMELREAISAVRDADEPFDALGHIMDVIIKALMAYEQELVVLFSGDTKETMGNIADIIKKMQFFRRLEQEGFELEAELEDIEAGA
ncbi:MAG: Fe-S protein assembly co-chaperone HscB [Gammaproteobacteria bacterium]|nr:Fe-S protein assembly co-chaperone HscB [Gammaproteobacteria bacterium]